MTTKTYDCFEVEIADKIAHIRLNRPDALNAMNKAFWNELPEIVREIDQGALAVEARSTISTLPNQTPC